MKDESSQVQRRAINGHLATIVAGTVIGILLVFGVIFYSENQDASWMPPRAALSGVLLVVYGIGFLIQAAWNKVLERRLLVPARKASRIPIIIKWQGPAVIGIVLILVGAVQVFWIWHNR